MQNSPKILVVQIGKIGDMILTTPLLSELKRLYPNSELSVLASAKNSAISKNLKIVNNTFEYNKKFFHTLKLILTFRRKQFDFWIDTKDEYSSTSKFLKTICKPKKSLGFNVKEKVFDVNLKDFVNGSHRVDINLSPVNNLVNIKDLDRIMPRIDIPENDSVNVIKRLENLNEKRVLLNLSAGISTRDLATEKWIEIANGINPDYSVILTGQEKDYDSINKVLNSIKRENIFFIETNSIFELAELIKQCSLIVTPDTSAVHLASCFNTPIVCFFHNVEWVRIKFAPLSKKQRIVVSKDENSFNSITSDELLKEVKELLA